MKKILLTLAATAMCTGAFAGTRVLYQQNFETVTDPAEVGWTYGGASMQIASDFEGKYLVLNQGQENGRSAQLKWGNEIYTNKDGAPQIGEDGKYTVEFGFSILQGSNNQYNSEFTIFTNHEATTNNKFRLPWSAPLGPWDNFLFDMSQWEEFSDWPTNKKPVAHPYEFSVNAPIITKSNTVDDVTTEYTELDYSDYLTFDQSNWYKVTLEVDINNRTVDWNIMTYSYEDIASGTRTVPETDLNGEPISMYAEGLFILVARYQTQYAIDDIKIYTESDQDEANPPTIALTSVGKDAEDNLDLKLRTYTITFIEGETLHVTGTDGNTEVIEYADCDGAYKYTTATSGTLKAWTTNGEATSEVAEMEVDCTPCILPTAEVKITSVEEGYGKTYTLSVENANVPLQPTIFINCEFVGKSGNKVVKEDMTSGSSFEVTEEGTLTLTTAAFGYQGSTSSVENNIEYVVKKEYDFARMSKEDLIAKGFEAGNWTVTNSGNTSGWDNWTARKRLFYYDLNQPTGEVDDAGNPTYKSVFPFGFIAEDNTTNVLESCTIGSDVNTDDAQIFEGINVYGGHNLSAILHVGVTNNETTGGNDKIITVPNLDPTDVVIANKIGSYGGNSCHPIVATVEEYYEALEGEDSVYLPKEDTKKDENDKEVGLGTYTASIPVYRIDTVCVRLTIYAQANNGGSVEGVEAAVEGDGYYYTIDGMRLAEPTRPGLYIHQGKKIIVK